MGAVWATQNSCYMQESTGSKLRESAVSIGLPTFIVADAGKTQVAAGSKTVLAVGPGPKATFGSVTGFFARTVMAVLKNRRGKPLHLLALSWLEYFNQTNADSFENRDVSFR